jgi:hypothetical protein
LLLYSLLKNRTFESWDIEQKLKKLCQNSLGSSDEILIPHVVDGNLMSSAILVLSEELSHQMNLFLDEPLPIEGKV